MAFAISKEVLNNLIRSCELLYITKEGVERFFSKKLLADMPEYQINEDGAICGWMHPDFDDRMTSNTATSHTFTPCSRDTRSQRNQARQLYEACRIAIKKRPTIGLSSQPAGHWPLWRMFMPVWVTVTWRLKH